MDLMLEQCGDVTIQSHYYNEWTYDHHATNGLVFAASGRVNACTLNSPGCLHDYTVTAVGNVYAEISTVYKTTGGRCIVDQAFLPHTTVFLAEIREGCADRFRQKCEMEHRPGSLLNGI